MQGESGERFRATVADMLRQSDIFFAAPPSLDQRCCDAADRAFIDGDMSLSRHLGAVAKSLHWFGTSEHGMRGLAAVSAFLAGDGVRDVPEATREALADAAGYLVTLADMPAPERDAAIAEASRARYGGHLGWATPVRS